MIKFLAIARSVSIPAFSFCLIVNIKYRHTWYLWSLCDRSFRPEILFTSFLIIGVSFLFEHSVKVWRESEEQFYPFQDGGRYHIETSPFIFSANQWTGFYMISAFVMKGLKKKSSRSSSRFLATSAFLFPKARPARLLVRERCVLYVFYLTNQFW